jgi:hypothetical protein
MGLFDNFFKSKSPPSDDNSVETGAPREDPAKHSDAAARNTPHRADPSAFLHPKSFVPRGVGPLGAPAKSGASSGVRKPGGAPAPTPAEEIVLTLGDVLSRIPTHYLKAGQHDPKREMRFSINDLSSDIARGRAAVPLSRIAELMPDIFVRGISRDEDTEVRLPLQKLVEQIGLLRSRPLGYSSDKSGLPPAGATRLTLPAPDAKAHFPEPMMEVAEPARDTLSDLLVPVEPVFELKPSAPPSLEPIVELKPVATPVAEPLSRGLSAPPENPAPSVPPVLSPEAPPASRAPVSDSTEALVTTTPLQSPPDQTPDSMTVPSEELPSPRPAEIAPPIVALPSPMTQTPVEIPGEPVVPPVPAGAPPALPLFQESMSPEPVEAIEAGDEQIELSLAAILRQCPPEIVVGELPTVPEEVTITLPFAPIDRQLVMGHVEISAVRFVAALPFPYQKYFSARMGVKVPIPLEEVFQNLPSPVSPASREPAPPELPPSILAPIAPDAAVPPTETVAALPISIADAEPVAEKSLLPVSLEADRAPEIVPQDAAPLESPPSPALPHLDLPAFHLFMPPPPVIVADHSAPVSVAPAAAPELFGTPPLPEPIPEVLSPERLAEVTPAPAAIEVSTGDMIGEMVQSPLPQGDPEILEVAAKADSSPISRAPADIPEPEAVEAPESLVAENPVLSDLPVTNSNEQPEVTKADLDGATSTPPAEHTSSSVFDEATQIIPPPRMIRPFIVLPPPIFGFTPNPDVPISNVPISDELEEEEIERPRSEYTLPAEIREAVAPDREVPTQGPPNHTDAKSSASAGAEDLPHEAISPEPEPSVLPGIISIDFSRALVAPEEHEEARESPSVEIRDLPPLGPGEPAFADAPVPGSSVLSDAIAPAVVEMAPLVFELVPPSSDDRAVAPPAAKKPFEAPSGAITFIVEGRFAEPVPPPFAPPEPAAAPIEPAVMATTPTEAVPPPFLAPEPEPAPEPLLEPALGSPEERVADLEPVTDLEPVADLEAVADSEPVADLELVADAETVTLAVLAEAESVAPAPLLTLPRLMQEFSQGDVVLPPALPLQRFNQDALQALFMTEEHLDLTRISRLAAQLPGVHACVIATRDQACTGGTLPEGFDLAALLGLAPRVGEAAGRMPIGTLKHFTLYGERYSVSFFERNGLSLCAVHRPRSFVPGVREKLVAIADELSK